ncbi:protein artemis-like [Nymphalis io]|uniref:protein artemis-like n=1 Tax=Inachis io TaxID=171585 RepID=UPI00216A2FDE|nr:protein artemis-like [Nymphalis io]
MSYIPDIMKSSFHGKIEEIPGVYVDNFENAKHQGARAYFLSHYHSDHIQGLHSAQLLDVLLKNNITIYSTELTAAIINDDKNDERIMKCVRALKMGSTLISLPALPEQDIPELLLTVTLIPAGHSAGSTMILFSTTTHNILFTGDFRINLNDLPKYKHLHVDDEPIKLDAMYVDTTFLDLKYEHFPKRSESVEKMIFEIRRWLNSNENNAIAIHTSAKYGYEYVFNEIYKQLHMKVFVSSEKWRFYSSIPKLVPGVTNNEESTRIHLCRNRSVDSSHTSCVQKCHNNYLFIHLSAMKWQNYEDGKCSVSRVTRERLDVCFATHCSKKEIEYFVDYFAPNKIIGFPREYTGRRKRNELCDNSGIDTKKVKIPKKVDADLLKLMFG